MTLKRKREVMITTPDDIKLFERVFQTSINAEGHPNINVKLILKKANIDTLKTINYIFLPQQSTYRTQIKEECNSDHC